MKRMIWLSGFAAAFLALAAPAPAVAVEEIDLPAQKWGFNGIFGTYDRAALRRGHQVYQELCAACHSLKRVAYRNLLDIGFTEAEVKEIAAEFEVQDGPNDDGEMFDRPAKPADRFVGPYANDQEARSVNNGALPPDLSLLVKARKGGADYPFAILTGYKEEPPEGFELGEDLNYNEFFIGRQIAMPPPLSEDGVDYADGTKATLEQQARDVVTFLAWAAEPTMEARKSMGIKVLLFLFLMTAMLYALKRRIWAKLH